MTDQTVPKMEPGVEPTNEQLERLYKVGAFDDFVAYYEGEFGLIEEADNPAYELYMIIRSRTLDFESMFDFNWNDYLGEDAIAGIMR